MVSYSYTNSGINFTIPVNDIVQFSKIANADSSFKRGKIVPLINAVEIDWNAAQVAGQTLNNTGEMLSILQTA